MTAGKHPRDALALLDRLGLYHAVFTDPAQPDLAIADISNWPAVYECLDMLEKTQTPGSIYAQLVRSAEARQYAWTLAALTPLEKLEDAPPPKPGKPSVPIAFLAAREGFKAPMKFCDLVTSARRNRTSIATLKNIVINKAEGLGERDRFGMAIREWNHKGGWRLQILSAILVDVMQRTAGETGQGLRSIGGQFVLSQTDKWHRSRLGLGRMAAVPGLSRGAGRHRGRIDQKTHRRHHISQSPQGKPRQVDGPGSRCDHGMAVAESE